MPDWINHIFRNLALLALLGGGMAVSAHEMPPGASSPAPHATMQMHRTHVVPHGDIPDHSLADPVCKQHCLGMATMETSLSFGHDPAPRLETPVVSQAQVVGLRPALPDPPPKTAV